MSEAIPLLNVRFRDGVRKYGRGSTVVGLEKTEPGVEAIWVEEDKVYWNTAKGTLHFSSVANVADAMIDLSDDEQEE